MIDIRLVEQFVDIELCRRGLDSSAQVREDFGLQGFFLLVGQLVSGMPEDFDAIVLIGIVGRGDHDTGGEGSVLGEVGDSRGGGDAGKVDADIVLSQTGGNFRSQPRAGFTGVHPDDDLLPAAAGGDPFSERGTGGGHGFRVERIFSRDTADSVGAE